MRTRHRREVIIHHDSLHRKVMLSHQADLPIYKFAICRVAILHREAIAVIHVFLFRN
jgi:hypothetical protein